MNNPEGAPGALARPEVMGDLRDRLLGLLDDPDGTLTELPAYFLRVSGISILICGCLHYSGGDLWPHTLIPTELFEEPDYGK